MSFAASKHLRFCKPARRVPGWCRNCWGGTPQHPHDRHHQQHTRQQICDNTTGRSFVGHCYCRRVLQTSILRIHTAVSSGCRFPLAQHHIRPCPAACYLKRHLNGRGDLLDCCNRRLRSTHCMCKCKCRHCRDGCPPRYHQSYCMQWCLESRRYPPYTTERKHRCLHQCNRRRTRHTVHHLHWYQ